jgi:hypothetical protein
MKGCFSSVIFIIEPQKRLVDGCHVGTPFRDNQGGNEVAHLPQVFKVVLAFVNQAIVKLRGIFAQYMVAPSRLAKSVAAVHFGLPLYSTSGNIGGKSCFWGLSRSQSM